MLSNKKKEMKGLQSYGITPEKLKMLEDFIDLVKFNYSILDNVHLKFLKIWLVNDLKSQIPDSYSTQNFSKNTAYKHRKYFSLAANSVSSTSSETLCPSDSESEMEQTSFSEVNLDDFKDDAVGDDGRSKQEMGDDSRQATEAEREEAMVMKHLGMDAFKNEDFTAAIKRFTTGILLDNSITSLFVKRGVAYLKIKKPYAAIRDAKKAIKLNPDSAPAFKLLGKAYLDLNKWVDSCKSYEEAQKIDYETDIEEIIKEIKPKARQIQESMLLKEKKRKEKEIQERKKRLERKRLAKLKLREQSSFDRFSYDTYDKNASASNFSFKDFFDSSVLGTTISEASIQIPQVEDELD